MVPAMGRSIWLAAGLGLATQACHFSGSGAPLSDEGATQDAQAALGPPDAGAIAPDAVVAPPDAASGLACDPADGATVFQAFEDPSLVGMEVSLDDGMVEVTGLRAACGGAALHAATTPGSATSQAKVEQRAFDELESGAVYLRAYVYLPSSVDVGRFTILSLAGGGPPYVGVAVGLGPGGALQLEVSSAPEYLPTETALPRDRWTCLMVEVDVAQDGSAALVVDGAPVVSASDLDTVPGGGATLAAAGILWAPADQGPAEIYIDELVVDTVPLTCE